MNKYDRERINMIIAMVMYITRLPERKISPYVKRTKTYLDILNGDELTLYDSYAANLMEMAREWKKKPNIPSVLRNITAEQIDVSNTWLRERKIKDSRQAKLHLSSNLRFKQSPEGLRPQKAAMAVRVPRFRSVERFQKASITTEEPLYKDI